MEKRFETAMDADAAVRSAEYAAVSLCRQLAENGNPEAQCELGVAYMQGFGLTRDERKAVQYFELAANAGHGLAQFNLAVAYILGQGIAQDRRKAMHWFRSAAERGVARAQFILGSATGMATR